MQQSGAARKAKEPKLQDNLAIDRFAGTWHELYRTKNARFEGANLKESYTKVAENKIKIHFEHDVNGIHDEGDGEATFDPARPAQWQVVFHKYFFPRFFPADFRILETDYDNYCIILSKNTYLWVFTTQFAWIMSRHKNLDQKIVEHCFKVIERETGLKRACFDQQTQ